MYYTYFSFWDFDKNWLQLKKIIPATPLFLLWASYLVWNAYCSILYAFMHYAVCIAYDVGQRGLGSRVQTFLQYMDPMHAVHLIINYWTKLILCEIYYLIFSFGLQKSYHTTPKTRDIKSQGGTLLLWLFNIFLKINAQYIYMVPCICMFIVCVNQNQ